MVNKPEGEKEIKITWKQFDITIKELVKKITNSNEKFDAVFGIPRGGLITAVKLSHLLKISLVTEITKEYKNILVVDDISDTGKTLQNLKDILDRSSVKYKIATLFFRGGSSVNPNYYVF